MSRKAVLGCGAGLMALALATGAWGELRTFDIPAQDATKAVPEFARQAGVQIVAPGEQLRGVRTKPLRGQLDARAALATMLEGTGLALATDDGSIITLRKGQSRPQDLVAAAVSGERPETVSEIVVTTGSRIRGAPPTAPVITATAEDMKNAGQSDLGEYIRSLPQNFGGGQNPGIGNTQGATNTNVNSASSLNLRGMGPDATLTLLNGGRLSYNSVNSAVDISAIPIAAINRVEILADGASALYGSDAVAGVANIVLKRDYQGVTASARLGATTDGGGTQQQYNVVAGRVWDRGGFIATYDYFRNSVILAADRSVTSAMHPDTTIYPMVERHSAILSGHQALTSAIEVAADVTYKKGRTGKQNGQLLGQQVTYRGSIAGATSEAYGISPRVNVTLGDGWTATVLGFYGADDTGLAGRSFANGALTSLAGGFYNNRARSIEANAEGALIQLPGGDVRLAVGLGHRSNSMDTLRSNNGAVIIGYDVSQKVDYGFAELFLPIIGRENGAGIVTSLAVVAAGRYENYRGMDKVLTPKLGANLDLASDVIVSLSWGRSFKAPTFYQQYSEQTAILRNVSGYGTTFPAGATYFQVGGASRSLKPERSESWSSTIAYRPHWLPRAEVSVSYFDVDYADRIANPVTSLAGVLINPVFADLVTPNPSPALLAAYIAQADIGLQNGTALPFDASKVIALVDTRNRNVTRFTYTGVDVSARYRFELSGRREVSLSGAASYLKSEQQLKAGLPKTVLAGTVFNPAHWRTRGGAVYQTPRYSLSAFVSYVEGVTDNRRTVLDSVGSVTTLDMTGRLRLRDDIEIAASVLNLFDAKPDSIFTASVFDTSFDTTNYSANGRFVGITLTKTW